MRSRFRWALAIYAAIGACAWFTLDGNLRWLVLVLLAALAIKSWVAVRREQIE